MLTITDELDAVNAMLSAIGSDPVNSLVDTTDVDVFNALRLLEKTSRDVQRKGWNFNTGTYTMYPNLYDKKILWDNTIIQHKSTDGNTYIKRGNYLYDMTNQTFEFTDKIELTVTRALDFTDLPDCFKNYITAKAAFGFQARYFGDAAVTNVLQMDLAEAYQDIVEYDLNMQDVNALQFTSVSEVMTRS